MSLEIIAYLSTDRDQAFKLTSIVTFMDKLIISYKEESVHGVQDELSAAIFVHEKSSEDRCAREAKEQQ